MVDPSVMLANLRLDNKSENHHFKIVKSLGSGAFGCVDLCTVEQDKSYAKKGDQVAIKRIKTVANAEMAKNEALVLSKLNHPCIVRYLDNFKDNLDQLCIVMEYCDKGTLEDWLSSRSVKPLEEYNIWRMVGMFSRALSFLHSQHPPILHNDLKPANILCKTDPADSRIIEIIISDFGVCNVPGQTPSAMYDCTSKINGGTICYLAPEVLRGDDDHITTSADMWSLGAVLTYIANDRNHLFRRESDVLKWRGDHSPMRRQFKYPLHHLVLSLLNINKQSRLTAEQVQDDIFEHLERGKSSNPPSK